MCAGAIMYAVARLTGSAPPARASWKSALIIGGALLLCGNGAVTIAEKWVPTGLAALLVATVPIYIAVLGWLSRSAPPPTPLVAAGLIGGFVGVGVLVGPAFAAPNESKHLALGMAILLVGSLVWSAGSLYSRHVRHSSSFILSAGQQMICGGGLLLLLGWLLGEAHQLDLRHITALSLGAFVYLVLIGAIVGYTAYFFLLRHCDPARVATYAYVNPLVALLLGAFFAGEHLSLRTWLGAGLIIASVAVVITAQQLTGKPPLPVTEAVVGADCAR
jgi:drug/metabolite transporter (DMT)-like permease